MNLKFLIGLLLALLIGLACRAFGVPLPAPMALIGALLVLAMTVGYQLTDQLIAQRKRATKMAQFVLPIGKSKSEKTR